MGSDSKRSVTVFTRATEWLGLPRLFSAIQASGFSVDLICDEGSFARHSSCVDSLKLLRLDQPDAVWIDALMATTSEHLLLGDDFAVDWLLEMSARRSALASFLGARGYNVANMALARNKYRLAGLAVRQAVPAPPVKLLTDNEDASDLAADFGWPLVLKSVHGFAGREVGICADAAEVRHAQTLLLSAGEAFAQQFVAGTALMVPVACRNGQVLSKFAALKRSTWPPVTGPSTIVEISGHSEAGHYVDVLVAELGLSGLISFDFILDAQQNYWLLECNLRPVPVSHFRNVLIDAWLHNQAKELPEGSGGLLALYPQSLIYPVDLTLCERAVLDNQIDDHDLSLAYRDCIAKATQDAGTPLR